MNKPFLSLRCKHVQKVGGGGGGGGGSCPTAPPFSYTTEIANDNICPGADNHEGSATGIQPGILYEIFLGISEDFK